MGRRLVERRRILITGASSGIGRALAYQLTRRRATLLLTARRGDLLEELQRGLSSNGGTAYIRTGDITHASFRQQLMDDCRSQLGGLDILVNNAGVGASGQFAEATPDRLNRIMDVNFIAPVELIRAALPLLRDGDQPAIVNVGSVLGHRAVPGKSEYCASKFALHGFSDALRAELAPCGIDVLHVCPSTTDTEFFDRLVEDRGSRPRRARGMSADAVAKHIVRAIERRRSEIVLSPGGKLLVWIDRCWPALANWLVARFG